MLCFPGRKRPPRPEHERLTLQTRATAVEYWGSELGFEGVRVAYSWTCYPWFDEFLDTFSDRTPERPGPLEVWWSPTITILSLVRKRRLWIRQETAKETGTPRILQELMLLLPPTAAASLTQLRHSLKLPSS